MSLATLAAVPAVVLANPTFAAMRSVG